MSKRNYTVFDRTMTLCMQGDRVEDAGAACAPNEYGTFDNIEAAIAEAREVASDPESVKLIDQRKGIGAVEHRLVWVDAFIYDDDYDEWVPCDEDGSTEGPCGAEPVYCHDCLDDRPDIKAAWDKAVRSKWDYMDYESDEFCTVRSFLEDGK